MDIPFGNGAFGKADLHFQTMQGNVLLDAQLFDSFDQIQYKPPSSEKIKKQDTWKSELMFL